MPSEVDSEVSSPPPVDQAYAEALGYLYGRINYEKIGNPPYTLGNYRLDRMRFLLEVLGNPHLGYSIVHVAGTKGKGTTSTLIADCLTQCGLRTGLYTSPHLLRLEERIQFQGLPCRQEELIALTASVRAAATEVENRGQGRATFFELTTAMGLLHFAHCQADAVLLEVGLGGRLDSTNVCLPVVSVITSISLDHQAQLGNTVEAIAREKAGIIKPGVPVVCSARDPAAQRAITEVAAAQGSVCLLIDRDYSLRWSPMAPTLATPDVRAEVLFFGEPGGAPSETDYQASPATEPGFISNSAVNHAWPTRLLGRHQAENIGATLATIKVLRKLGWDLPTEKLRQAISRSQPRARLEVVDVAPLSVIDSAHNPASIRAGLDALADHFPDRPLTIVFAASRDKDWQQMLELLLPRAQRLILTAYLENPRGLPLVELSSAAQKIADSSAASGGESVSIETSASPVHAWHRARAVTTDTELVYATGSFFLAAEILAALEFSADRLTSPSPSV